MKMGNRDTQVSLCSGVSRRALIAGLGSSLAFAVLPLTGSAVFERGNWVLRAEDFDAT